MVGKRIWIWSVPGFHLYNLSLTLPLKVVMAIWFLCLSEQWPFNTTSDYLIIYSARWTLHWDEHVFTILQKIAWQNEAQSLGNYRDTYFRRQITSKLIIIRKESQREETSYVSECSLLRAINMSKFMKPNDTYWEITWTNSKTCYARPECDQL